MPHRKRSNSPRRKRLSSSYMTGTNLHQLKHAKDLLEAYNTKTSLMTFRKKLLDDQRKFNYSTEYDRIRGALAQSTQPFVTRDQLIARRNELKRLGAQALDIN